MHLTDALSGWARPARRGPLVVMRVIGAMDERVLPILLTLAIVAGLGFVAVSTPIAGRGDYGQWLMTARYYLGEPVPSYRDVAGLPPLVPILLAGLHAVIADPVATLQTMNLLLLLALAMSFYFVGAVLLRSPLGGTLSVLVALLVTDRFMELSAFGGLLQLAAVASLNVAVGSLHRAGDGGSTARRWWALGGLSLMLLAVSHVGTATVGLPIGIAIAGLSVIRSFGRDWRRLVADTAPFMVSIVAIAIYAVAVLVPASGDYVTNPASLAYRGPGRLMASLFAYWPTGAVLIIGAGAAVVSALSELIRRRIGSATTVLVWALVAWALFVVSWLTGASTDYPRFATLLMAPLALAVASVLMRLAQEFGERFHPLLAAGRASTWTLLAAAAAILIAIPFSAIRYQAQMATYQPRDATSLTAAIAIADSALGSDNATVLTTVRDGKWLEGMTGREALFSQPVRYAFRTDEWQRSIDAEALLRSSAAMTNQFFFVRYADRSGTGALSTPSGLTISMNHGGEFVDVLQQGPADTHLTAKDKVNWVGEAGPQGMSTRLTRTAASLTTSWHQARGSATVSFSRTVALLSNGSTLTLTADSPGHLIQTVLRPASGIALTSLLVAGREAEACFTLIGDRQPCVRIWSGEPDAVLQATDAGLAVRTTTSTRLELYVTDLTPGDASVGLKIIDPATLLAQRDVRGAILVQTDPAFDGRRTRLESLGFELKQSVGLYAVFIRHVPVAGGP
jgi:hypothetical protein